MAEKQINVSNVRKNLPSLVDEVRDTREPVIITRRGRPIAKIVPCSHKETLKAARGLPLRGLTIRIAPDFDEPLDENWEALKE